MTKDARLATAILVGGIGLPAFIYFISGPDVWPWWMYALMAFGGAGAAYSGMTETQANERIADRED